MLRSAALLALLLLLAVAGAAANEGTLEGGRFTLLLAGREAGAEVVLVTRSGDRLTLTSRATLRRDDREQALELSVVLDIESLDVLRVDVRGVAGDRVVTATLARDGDRLVGEVREGEAARSVAFRPAPGAIPLVDPFSAPYLLVAARFDLARGVPVAFPAFYPLTGDTGDIAVVRREEQALVLDGRVELASRLLATPDRGDVANLWLAGDGRLLVAARSVAGLSAVRGDEVTIGLGEGEDPPAPEGVTAFRVRFAAEGAVLAGTFLRPAACGGPCPAALILSGSGPQDRNGNAPGTELQWNPLASIAGALAGAGVATLRYDERGVGRSGGHFPDAAVTDLLSDARSALDFLRSRDDVDPARVAIVGHSEGALLAALLAAEAGATVPALVLIGPPAEPLDALLFRQIRDRLDGREMEERERQRILGDLRAYFEHVRLSSSPVVTWEGRSRPARWLRQHMEIEPLDVYRSVRAPALVVQGGRDAQVPPAGAREVERALPQGELLEFGTLDHFLMRSTGELRDYADAGRRMDATALSVLAEWLSGRLRPR